MKLSEEDVKSIKNGFLDLDDQWDHFKRISFKGEDDNIYHILIEKNPEKSRSLIQKFLRVKEETTYKVSLEGKYPYTSVPIDNVDEVLVLLYEIYEKVAQDDLQLEEKRKVEQEEAAKNMFQRAFGGKL